MSLYSLGLHLNKMRLPTYYYPDHIMRASFSFYKRNNQLNFKGEKKKTSLIRPDDWAICPSSTSSHNNSRYITWHRERIHQEDSTGNSRMSILAWQKKCPPVTFFSFSDCFQHIFFWRDLCSDELPLGCMQHRSRPWSIFNKIRWSQQESHHTPKPFFIYLFYLCFFNTWIWIYAISSQPIKNTIQVNLKR